MLSIFLTFTVPDAGAVLADTIDSVLGGASHRSTNLFHTFVVQLIRRKRSMWRQMR